MQLDPLLKQYSNFDVKMAWDIKTIDRKTVIDGIIQNIRYSYMEDLEIWINYPGTDDKIISRAADLTTPGQLVLGDTTAFRVILQTIVPHGAKLVFTYKYIGYDGSDGAKWMQSFESKAP